MPQVGLTLGFDIDLKLTMEINYDLKLIDNSLFQLCRAGDSHVHRHSRISLQSSRGLAVS